VLEKKILEGKINENEIIKTEDKTEYKTDPNS